MATFRKQLPGRAYAPSHRGVAANPSAVAGSTRSHVQEAVLRRVQAGRRDAVSSPDVLRLQRALGNRATQQLLDPHGDRASGDVAPDTESLVARAADRPAQSMPQSVSARLGEAFGTDVSHVRIHADEGAAQAAAALSAHAYTIGQDVYFAAGRYAPTDASGFHLLAHEVAHTVQHRAGTAAARHFKLDVSTPGDTAEIEAERAADSAASGQPFQISGAAPAIHRDAAPPDTATPPQPAGAPLPATAPPVPATTPAGGTAPAATGAPAPASDQVTASWSIDWKSKATKGAVTSQNNVRTGKDAAYGSLKIDPEGARLMQVFPWVNAAPQGAVPVGSMPHAKGKGGMLSSSIQYGTPPSASAVITVTETADADKKAKPQQSQVAAKKKAATVAVQAKLEEMLATQGEMPAIQAALQAAATQAIGAAPPGYSYEAKVALTPHYGPDAGVPRSAPSVKYDKFDEDGKRIVTISVPTEVQKLKGSASVEKSMKDASSNASSSATKDESTEEQLDEKTTEQVNRVKTSFTSAFDSAWQKVIENSKKNRTRLSGSFEGKLDTSVLGGAGFKGLTVNVDKLITRLLLPEAPFALLLSGVFGTATVDGNLKASIAGALDIGLKADTEWSDENIEKTLNAFTAHVKQEYEQETESSVKTYVRNMKSSSHAEEHKDDKSASHESGQKTTSSTETIGVKYVVGDPEITIIKN